MKKVLLILCTVIAALSFNACKSSQSASSANSNSADDIAYIYFVSNGQYVGKQVDVKVDDYTKFDATPAKSKDAAEAKGVAAGKRHMVVSCNGKTLYDETISVKTGAKKVVKLP